MSLSNSSNPFPPNKTQILSLSLSLSLSLLTHTQTICLSNPHFHNCSLSLSLSIFSTASHFCHFLQLFRWCWLHCARESPQHLLFHWQLQGAMESEKYKKSKIYLCAISCECEHTSCHKIYHIMRYSSVNREILFLSQSTFSNQHFRIHLHNRILFLLHSKNYENYTP